MRCVHAMPFGATLAHGRATWRLWAPAANQVELLLHAAGTTHAIGAEPVGDGWYQLRQDGVGPGQRYQWRIDGGLVVPDPASRCNPQGPHAPSALVDPGTFAWDDDWLGRPWHDAVFYQLHVGCFTPEGTFDAAVSRLPALARLGITALQLMPLADWPGRFGWGYDGVLPYAPFHGYGPPEALKRLVQAAHRLGLMVFGDVVYNHFGPDGNYLHAYSPDFFTERHRTAWGPAINFDGERADTVREFFIHNALYWLQEFRFDGLRLDAVHAMRDDSRPHILDELSQRVRASITDRPVHLVLENDSNDRHRLAATPTPGRYDGQWNGDVHHALHVLLTDEHDGYYAEYDEPVAQLGRSLAHGFAREGGPHNVVGAPPRRAAEGDAPLTAMVNFLQNHDQIGNRAFGDRLTTLAEPAALRLAAAIVLLSPTIPMLFMGEEQGATVPFLFFADWDGALRDAVQRGRQDEFAHFPRHAEAAAAGQLPDPCSRDTFERCRVPEPAPGADETWPPWYAGVLKRRADRLRPVLPRLAASGHEAWCDGLLLRLRWRFDAAPGQPARVLQMQVNLSTREAPATAPPADSEALFEIGHVRADRLGPWAGRWHWLSSTGAAT
jgi:maltooligosyltrehalose trehalohydrolase